MPTAIYACFVLHNYCEHNNCVVNPQSVKIQITKHKLDSLTNPNKNTLFGRTLMNLKLLVMLFSHLKNLPLIANQLKEQKDLYSTYNISSIMYIIYDIYNIYK